MPNNVLWYVAGLAFLLAFVVVLFFWYRDKYEREPPVRIGYAFLIGCLSTIPPLITNSIGFLILGEIIVVCVLAPIFEETSKGFGIYIMRNDQEMDGMMDGLVYGASIGAGFAFIENILYGLNMFDLSENLAAALGLTVFRSIVMPIGHSLYTGTTGSEFGKNKLDGVISKPWYGLGIAILMHAGWNTCATIVGIFAEDIPELTLLTLFIIVFYAWFLNRKMNEALALERPDKLRSKRSI